MAAVRHLVFLKLLTINRLNGA